MTKFDSFFTAFVEAAPLLLRAVDAAWCTYIEVRPAGKLLATARAIEMFRDYLETH